MMRALRFIGVGCGAAAVHWGLAVVLIERAQIAAALANAAGWIVAFGVSLVGHHSLTFADRQVPFAQAARRMAVLSAAGFAVNESAYLLLLRFQVWNHRIALAVVLVGVAGVTYLLSRRWAFAEPSATR